MLNFKDVSKYYYNKGIITTGFTRVNLELNIGEFVAITGESGSGKSTLLNVISGLDSYEEGEMYINGKETSHYSLNDFEEYRKKYIANIFQTFNLVNSYTVYQNIELILLINGIKKDNPKKSILDLIDKVGLTKYKNTKVSKLSGGQKQRVAIARALMKDTPIIVADEPTGSLDKKASESVLALLSEISKDKLVVVVTHNYEQIEQYVTRRIVMHDGKIIEDKKIKKVSEINENNINDYGSIKLFNRIKLGIRNSFNVLPKFFLLLLVYLFLIGSIIAIYSSRKYSNYVLSHQGNNQYFKNTDSKRIIAKKEDNKKFSDSDYYNIKNIDNVDYIIKEDIVLDKELSGIVNNYSIQGNIKSINEIKSVDKGVMPSNDYEIVITIDNDYDNYVYENILNEELEFENYNIIQKLKVVGIIFTNNYSYKIYVSAKVFEEIKNVFYEETSNVTIKLNSDKLYVDKYTNTNNLYPTSQVKSGEVIINNDLTTYCNNENCQNDYLNINVNNIYINNSIKLKISKIFNNKNFNSILKGIDEVKYQNAIFINDIDYRNLFNTSDYQISIFVKDDLKVDKVITELNNLHIKNLYVNDTLVRYESDVIGTVFSCILLIMLIVVIFFVCYFVIKIILKSRNVYYSTLRILGSSKKIVKDIIDIELYNFATISFIIILFFIKLLKNIEAYKTMLGLLNAGDYIVLYIIIIILSKLISMRYSKSLFKKTAMNTIKESV